MSNFIQKIKRHEYGIIIMTIAFAIEMIYLTNTTANVPMMDYWRYGKDYLYDIFNGGVKFSDFWESINGQRAFLTYTMFFINVKYFHWNTRLSIFFGAFITYVTGLLFVRFVDKKKYIDNERANEIVKICIHILVAIILFNYVQWEIKVLEFYAPFSVIVLVGVLNLWLADFILNNLQISYDKILLFTIFMFLSICFIYTAFFPAIAGAIILCGLFNLILRFKEDKWKYFGKYLLVGIGILSATLVYMIGIEGVTGDTNNFETFLRSIVNGDMLKCIILYLGSSLVHVSLEDKIGFDASFVVGVFLIFIYIVAVIMFIKNIKNTHSYFPIMLILYTLLVGILLSYGRGGVYGFDYMTSSRYAFQSKMGLIGVILIYIDYLPEIKRKWKQALMYIYMIGVSCFILVLLLEAQIVENNISPYRRLYYENLIDMMYNIEDVNDDDLYPFQARTADEVRDTVQYMKDYKLGVFYYNEERDVVFGTSYDEIKIYEGIYDDGWATNYVKVGINSGEKGEIVVDGYITEKIEKPKIEVYINDELIKSYEPEDMDFEFTIETIPNQNIYLELVSDFTIKDKGIDQRELSYIIQSIYGQ